MKNTRLADNFSNNGFGKPMVDAEYGHVVGERGAVLESALEDVVYAVRNCDRIPILEHLYGHPGVKSKGLDAVIGDSGSRKALEGECIKRVKTMPSYGFYASLRGARYGKIFGSFLGDSVVERLTADLITVTGIFGVGAGSLKVSKYLGLNERFLRRFLRENAKDVDEIVLCRLKDEISKSNEAEYARDALVLLGAGVGNPVIELGSCLLSRREEILPSLNIAEVASGESGMGIVASMRSLSEASGSFRLAISVMGWNCLNEGGQHFLLSQANLALEKGGFLRL